MHITLAYAAASTIMDAYLEWKVPAHLLVCEPAMRLTLTVKWKWVQPGQCRNHVTDIHKCNSTSQDLHQGAQEAYRRQLAAADSSSAYTIVQNQLGVTAHLELDHGDHT